MNIKLKLLLPLLLLFISVTIILSACTALLTKWNIDKNILLTANALIFAMSYIAFVSQQKALQHTNPNVFFRAVTGGMMLRMFVFAIAVIAYKFLSGAMFSTAAVFISLLLYLVYLGLEVSIILKLNKAKNA